MERLEQERARARSFGFVALFVWALLGFCLEAAHAFKLSPYLDRPARRELLVWAHAHGVGLALVLIAYAAQGVNDARSARAGSALRFAAVTMPLGFLLGTLGSTESDPGPSIWLVPIAALTLLWALFEVSRGALRRRT